MAVMIDGTTVERQRIDFLDEKIMATLERLECEAERDRELIGSVSASLGLLASAPTSERLGDMTGVAEDALLPVAREVGCLLYQFAVAAGAATIIEYGTSYGMSTLYLAAAARVTGGRVIGTELSERKAAIAAANLAEAGLAAYAQVLVGDALHTLREVGGPVDLTLLDGWVPLYLPVFQLLEPRFRVGSVIVSDNVSGHADKIADFHRYLAAKADTYVRTSLPIDDGIDVIVRVR